MVAMICKFIEEDVAYSRCGVGDSDRDKQDKVADGE